MNQVGALLNNDKISVYDAITKYIDYSTSSLLLVTAQ